MSPRGLFVDFNCCLERDAEHNGPWLERMREFKRLAEAAHQRV